MVEWALYVSGQGALDRLRERSPPDLLVGEWPELEGLLPPDLRLDRLYYGQELCERLVPSAREIRDARAMARACGWRFSVVTYAPSDDALDRWITALDAIREDSASEDGLEIVVNDFGLLVACRVHLDHARIVLGRHMKRMLKDHRLPDHLPEVSWHQAELELLGRSGASRFELDLTPGGLADVNGAPLPVSAYLPCGYLATGRVCMSGSRQLRAEDKFRPGVPCARECRTIAFDLEDPVAPRDVGVGPRLFMRGNTVFFVPPRGVLAASLETVGERGYDRAVLQLGPPLGG